MKKEIGSMDREKIQKVVSRHRHEKAAILSILHEVQEHDKQLEMESLRYIAQLLKVSFANVYGLATFYDAFSIRKKGEMEIRACNGISCHINGADEVIETLKTHLNIELGETTWDEKFSLENVACLGLCSIGPNMALDGKPFSRLDKDKILKILKKKRRGI
ncbi:MAG: NAD(P)H-dependent oxidoreductase subunit E [Desulfobacteraceae bacterium]|nr:NAD(P)H-dependent oxidoreductase subunit E [Desulfobacteraceae bacterium]